MLLTMLRLTSMPTLSTALWLIFLLLSASTWLAMAYGFVLFRLRVPKFTANDGPPAPWPVLSVIVPCRNEARKVEQSMRTLLAQDYPALEIVAVNDRSTDTTGAILDRLAAEHPSLTVVHVTDLPSGWLGKNQACHLASHQARGSWLLFTDGDVMFAPQALRQAIAYATTQGLGHLVAIPRFIAPGYFERSFVAAFTLLFFFAGRGIAGLQRAGSRAYVGMGAFNLVRREDYQRVGGHTRLAMEVVDDVKLGLLLRRSGVPQGATDSEGQVTVRWQEGFGATLQGLVKNAFAGAEWRWSLTCLLVVSVLFVGLFPLAALCFAPTLPLKLMAILPLATSLLLQGASARVFSRASGWEALAFPFVAFCLAAVSFYSAVSATLHQGITWRGTHYPLAALRAGCLRESSMPASAAVGWESAPEVSAVRPAL